MSSRTTDIAADEERAAGAKAEGAEADEETGEASESGLEADRDGTEATTGDAGEGAGGEPAEIGRRGVSRVAAGAAAVVGAGLGLASLTGTWLSDVMSSRQELIGQINGQTATPQEQVATVYGSQWHTTALFNGFFALAAIIVAGAALVIPTFSKSEESPAWVRAVALGGLALGTIGLVIAAVMWFDVFTELPTVPEVQQPAVPG